MSTAIQQEPIVGQEPTHEEKELVAWAEEAAQKGLEVVRESLRQMVTLTTALLAGSTALLGQIPVPRGPKAIGAVLLLASLGFSLWGVYPHEARVDVTCPEAIRTAREGAAKKKMRCLKVASACLVLAFFVMLGGFFSQW